MFDHKLVAEAARILWERIKMGKPLSDHPISRGKYGAVYANRRVLFLVDEWPGDADGPGHRGLTDRGIDLVRSWGVLTTDLDGVVVRIDAGDHAEAWWVLKLR